MISIAENRDCLKAMREFPDKFFDLAVVDPPYGIGIVSPGKRTLGKRNGQPGWTNYKASNWDNKIPSRAYFKELFRVSKNQIIWGGNYFTKYLPASKGWVVWNKRQPEGVSFAMAELAWTSFNKSIKMFECSRAEIGNTVSNDRRLAAANAKIHPTQKPVSLYRWLFKTYSKPGQTIIDTHLGSASSRIASHDLGLDFYGYEIDKDYFSDSEARYRRHIRQIQLFNPQEQYNIQTTLV